MYSPNLLTFCLLHVGWEDAGIMIRVCRLRLAGFTSVFSLFSLFIKEKKDEGGEVQIDKWGEGWCGWRYSRVSTPGGGGRYVCDTRDCLHNAPWFQVCVNL